MNKTAIVLAAGVAGFVAYCIYFDHKRRNDQDYKKNVRERRRRNRIAATVRPEFPNLREHEAMERCFIREVQQGENLIANGDLDRGVEHLANAIVLCGQPGCMLQVLQASLPPHVFEKLMAKMQEFGHQMPDLNDCPPISLPMNAGQQQLEGAKAMQDASGAIMDDLE